MHTQPPLGGVQLGRIIVRRGRFLTYELLRRTFGGDPNVEIIWDRRREANAVPEGTPESERRGRPPDQWYRLDYLFTPGASGRFQPPGPKDPPSH